MRQRSLIHFSEFQRRLSGIQIINAEPRVNLNVATPVTAQAQKHSSGIFGPAKSRGTEMIKSVSESLRGR